ncbi:MAG: hypothetical protein LRZ84_13115 [Desertifilum sp.]|nr:hypothetical protein [Desertifilum sp.]
MRSLFSTLLSACSIATVAFALPALAASEIQISYDTPSFQNREITSGKVKVSVSYDGQSGGSLNEENNLRYTLYYDGQEKIRETTSTFNIGNISLQNLDSNGTPEVIVKVYSGGAHCCTEHTVYTWRGNNFTSVQFGPADGNGGRFEDLNQDGRMELIAFDNSFLYAFSSYAGSFPPSVILSYRDGNFEDVTRQYPQYLRGIAWQMYRTLERTEGENNGVLAGYVAQKILLGEFEDGWNFMLARYDRESDWGLDIRDSNGNSIGRHQDFPTALKAFLIETGYLNRNGQPNTALNLRDRIVR